MLFTKLGILLIGFAQASILPYFRKIHASFLSNKSLYGDKFVNGYKWLLITTALLTYAFFWLLTQNYDLGEYDKLMQYRHWFCTACAIGICAT